MYCNILGGGGGGSVGSAGEMVTQEDTIFVAGMDVNTSENDIAGNFGAIGLIKVRVAI